LHLIELPIPLSITPSKDSSGKRLISLTSICMSIEIHGGSVRQEFRAFEVI